MGVRWMTTAAAPRALPTRGVRAIRRPRPWSRSPATRTDPQWGLSRSQIPPESQTGKLVTSDLMARAGKLV